MLSKSLRINLSLLTTALFIIALGLLAQPISAWSKALWRGATVKTAVQKNDVRARESFLAALPVLKHPRCLNCHSTGDYPRQGDDGHIHTQNVRRGIDGKGKYGQKCSACHQEQNVAGLNMPPGAPNWQLPPATMPMIWEGRTPGQICRQLKDPKQNNGKTIAQIIEHVNADKLVLWGWNPGEGRSMPPLSHDDFAGKFQDWARYGAACPE
ncbi:MAG TPA: hypothetical protein VN920_13605 [Pyrinomonadaceae bacterium]|nr:hypothetical protein [Pyrinomonadaceae bacterium]